MPAKLLLNLRLLNPSLPTMNLGRPTLPLPSSSSTAAFSRLFPFRLKYHSLSLHHRRRFSARSDSAAGASRSLVDDEADLSDWVTDLAGTKSRGGGGGGSDGGFRGGRARDSSSGKRTRSGGSDSEGFGGPRGRRMARGSRFEEGKSFSRSSETSRRFDSKRDGNGGGDSFSPKRNHKFQEDRGSSFSSDRRFGARKGEEGSDSFPRNSRVSKRFGDGEFSTGKGGPRFQSAARKGGGGDRRDMEFGYKKGATGSRKQVALFSEDDDDNVEDESGFGIEEASKFGIGDLLSDDDESDTDEEEDGENIGNVVAKGSPSRASSGDSESYLSDTRFDQCAISPLSLKGIKDAGFEKMTVVQEATLPLILKGKDVLAKAKTGTGKTVAFLLPSIEVVVNSPPIERDQKRPPILVLVICPTRELACQAAAEADTLLKYHPSIGVQVVIGGTRLALEQKRMQTNPCQILVATPGRLRDHMENTAGFATRLMGVKVLVLDEADHLLDMGFRKDIEKIIAAVPKQRQTLLFSATVPEEVRQVCHIALKRDHEFINTVQGGSEDTHSQVKQMHLVAPLDKQFSLFYTLLKEHIADDVDYKVIVFCTTAMLTKLVAELLSELKMNAREIHSRKSQSYRTKVSDEFRKSKGLILVTSDVSARGVDYPDVTLVIQLGLPADKQQYIHRLGRTGRKGKEGEGILLLAPWEEFFLSSIKDLPITKATQPSVDPDTKRKVERGLSNVEMKSKEAAYQAWLGYYNSNKTVGRDKYKLVELANEFSRSMGLDNPPAIPKLVIGKMGLKNIPGLRVR